MLREGSSQDVRAVVDTVVLEKTVVSPLDSKEFKPVMTWRQ